jgi:hypothetical protein
MTNREVGDFEFDADGRLLLLVLLCITKKHTPYDTHVIQRGTMESGKTQKEARQEVRGG